jgi:hypothetical protein
MDSFDEGGATRLQDAQAAFWDATQPQDGASPSSFDGASDVVGASNDGEADAVDAATDGQAPPDSGFCSAQYGPVWPSHAQATAAVPCDGICAPGISLPPPNPPGSDAGSPHGPLTPYYSCTLQ